MILCRKDGRVCDFRNAYKQVRGTHLMIDISICRYKKGSPYPSHIDHCVEQTMGKIEQNKILLNKRRWNDGKG